MAIAHSSLTGSDLHEPKGVASASNGDIYIANGSGSGSWSSATQNGSTAVYGEMYITGNSTNTVTDSAATNVQVVAGWVTGSVQDVSFDSNQLTINTDGMYLIQCAIALNRPSGAGSDVHKFSIAVDSGAGFTAKANLVARKETDSSATGSASISGLLSLNSNDNIGLLVQNEADTDPVLVTDCNLNLTMLRSE